MANDLMIQEFKDVTVVNFNNVGVLDSANIEGLGRTLLDLVEKQDKRKLVLDFGAVKFMSSQALGVMLQMKKALDVVKGQMVIAGMRPDLYKVFKITNLHKMFKFVDGLGPGAGGIWRASAKGISDGELPGKSGRGNAKREACFGPDRFYCGKTPVYLSMHAESLREDF